MSVITPRYASRHFPALKLSGIIAVAFGGSLPNAPLGASETEKRSRVKAISALRASTRAAARSLGVFVSDVGHGLLEISHNTLALIGLAIVSAVVFAAGQADLRQQAETMALAWLQTRHEARALESGDVLMAVADQDAVSRATAIDPRSLSRPQANVAQWIARRYKVAPEPIGRLVHEAWSIGERAAIDPTLILAVMAVESSFNPFAQSHVGAQGLMQVMTRIHDDKYSAFGGNHAAFDPLTNLRVGVQVLKDCIAQAGSVEGGLKFYVGAANMPDDGGYVAKVLAEQSRLRSVADGRPVPTNAPNTTAPVRDPSATANASIAAAPSDERVALLR